MASLVTNFQKDILNSKKSVTEILRTAKLISAKLGLTDISEWISFELGGYPEGAKIPEYRQIKGWALQVRNPALGWQSAGYVDLSMGTKQPVSELEELMKGEFVFMSPPHHVKVQSFGELDELDGLVNQFPQRLSHSTVAIKSILESIKEQLLNWTIELEQRGIIGEDMSFDKAERQKAQNQTFNIQHFSGVLGDVNQSNVNLYDYSSIHQLLKQKNIPQGERNNIENILDELKSSPSEKKATIIEKGKAWIVKNQEFLGAGASIVRQALGIPDVT
jgi:hypothetical protein